MTERNAESDVLDAIDALVEESLATPYSQRSGWDNDVHQPRCALCGREFHGLPRYGCPGEFGSQQRVPTDANGVMLLRPGDPVGDSGSWLPIDLPPGNPAHRCNLDRSGRCVWASCPTNQDVGSALCEPRWLDELIETTTLYVMDQIATVTGIEPYYTLGDLMTMRAQLWLDGQDGPVDGTLIIGESFVWAPSSATAPR